MPRRQHTIARTVRIDGFGYWTGRDVSLDFRPASPCSGIVFVRRDLTPPCRIAARVENRFDTPRRTTLVSGGGQVEMVEHVLAALAGLQIDNCEVWVDEAEMPGLDGSSQPLVNVLQEAGIQVQDAWRKTIVIRKVTHVGDERSWVEARPAKAPGMSVQYELDFGRDSAIGRQTFDVSITPESFRQDISPARTFVLYQEAQWLRSQGLAQRATYRDLLVFNQDGVIDNQLRFPDECVRHKVLDLIGDLALSDCDLHGRFRAHRSGHRLNAELVRALLQEYQTVNRWEDLLPERRRCA